MSASVTGNLVRSYCGTVLFVATGGVVGVSILTPTAILTRGWRSSGRDTLQLVTILFTWCVPLVSLLVALFPGLLPFYWLFSIILAGVIASNVAVFVLYRPPMQSWQWTLIGFVLVLIGEQVLALWMGPEWSLAKYVLPFYSIQATYS